MDNWGILGIEPTKDKNKIKQAYREKLSVVNPEDDPEGFKALRQAFEVLTKKADEDIEEEEEEKEDLTSTGKWIKKVKNVYDKFSLRINEDSWKELLKDETAFALDTMDEAGEKLLVFLMDNYRLPQKIWIVLNDHFNFLDNKKELYERFPKEFIDYVESRVKYKDSINYDLFEDIDDNKDYEKYLSIYYKIKGYFSEGKLDEIKKGFEEISELGIYHPYLDELYVHYYINIKDYDKAREYAKKIYEKYPQEEKCIFAMAEVEWVSKNITEAEKLYDKVLEINPDHFDAKCGKADCLFEDNKLEDAKEMYENLLRISYYNNYIRDRIFKINEKIIDKLKAENSEELKDKFNLAWCLFDNNRCDEIIELMSDISVTKDFENQYCDLMGKTYSILKQPEKSIDYFSKWEERLQEGLADDKFSDVKEEGSKELTKEEALSQVNYINTEVGRNLYVLKKYDEAIVRYDAVLEKDESDITVLNLKGLALNKLKRYEESVGVYEKALSIDTSYAPLFINKAEALHELGYDGDAVDALEQAKEVYAYFPYIYELEMKIYCNHKEYDKVNEIYSEAESYQIVNDGINLQHARVLSSTDKKEQALGEIKKIIDNIEENGDECYIFPDCYYEAALILCDLEKYEEAESYINRGMEICEDKLKFAYARAFIYKVNKKYDRAIKEYKNITEMDPSDSFAYYKIGEIYNTLKNYEVSISWFKKSADLDKDNKYVYNEIGELYHKLGKYELAIENYDKALKISESSYVWVNRGIANERLKNYDEALSNYESASKLEPENPYPYNNIGVMYEAKGDNEKALIYYKKAVECSKDSEGGECFYNNLYLLLVNMFKLDEAFKCNEEAKAKFDNKYRYYYREAALYKKQRNFDKAISKAKDILKREDAPKFEYYEFIGDCYLAAKKYDESIIWYKKLFASPKHKKELAVYLNLALAYKDKKKYFKALYYIKKQIKYVKGEASNYLVCADILKKLGFKSSSYKYYKKALNIFLRNHQGSDEEDILSNYYRNLGRCYYGMHDYDNAIKYLNIALDGKVCRGCHCSRCYEAFYYLGEVYESKGDLQKAYFYLKQAYDMAPYDDDNIEGFNEIKQKMNMN